MGSIYSSDKTKIDRLMKSLETRHSGESRNDEDDVIATFYETIKFGINIFE